MPQPSYDDGDWPSYSRFVWGPEDKVLIGHWTVISTARDLEEYLGEPLTQENVEAFRARELDEDVKINWPLIEAGLRRRGLLDCGCAYELVEDGAVQRKRWFHEPGCPNA